MADRTTIKTLRILVDTLNDVTGHPRSAWANEDSTATLGVYILDSAYGGYRLAQIIGETGGERSNITDRYGAAITADLIRAYMAGIREGREPRR